MIILLVNLVIGVVIFVSIINLIRRTRVLNKIKREKDSIILAENSNWKRNIVLIVIINIIVLISLILDYEAIQLASVIVIGITVYVYYYDGMLTIADNEGIYTISQTIKFNNVDSIEKYDEKRVNIRSEKGFAKTILVKNTDELINRYKMYLEVRKNKNQRS